MWSLDKKQPKAVGSYQWWGGGWNAMSDLVVH